MSDVPSFSSRMAAANVRPSGESRRLPTIPDRPTGSSSRPARSSQAMWLGLRSFSQETRPTWDAEKPACAGPLK